MSDITDTIVTELLTIDVPANWKNFDNDVGGFLVGGLLGYAIGKTTSKIVNTIAEGIGQDNHEFYNNTFPKLHKAATMLAMSSPLIVYMAMPDASSEFMANISSKGKAFLTGLYLGFNYSMLRNLPQHKSYFLDDLAKITKYRDKTPN